MKDNLLTAIFAIIFVLGVSGWVMNVINLASNIDTLTNAQVCVHILGVLVAPVGSILGWVL